MTDPQEWSNSIPPMTHPLSSAWDQPRTDRILVDDTHAVMTLATFRELLDYSGSQPSGVYEGKMWRRHDGVFDRSFLRDRGKPVWMLCWFGFSLVPNMVSNHRRIILLVDADVEVQR